MYAICIQSLRRNLRHHPFFFAVGPVSFLKDYSFPWSQLLWGQASERLHSVSWLSQNFPSDGTVQLKQQKGFFVSSVVDEYSLANYVENIKTFGWLSAQWQPAL